MFIHGDRCRRVRKKIPYELQQATTFVCFVRQQLLRGSFFVPTFLSEKLAPQVR